MVSAKTRTAYRLDVSARGKALTATEREKLARPYLPRPLDLPNSKTPTENREGARDKEGPRATPLRTFVKNRVYLLLYQLIHLLFGIYIRFRQIHHASVDRILAILYYHHRTPALIQKDVKNLCRIPEHLSVILTFGDQTDGGLESLLDDVAELCAWCASAGIPLLNVYEKSGLDNRP